MKKTAFFVEGQTERIFIEKLIEEYFSFPDYDIVSQLLIGNDLKTVRKRRKSDDANYFFLIFDVSCDGKLVSYIKEKAKDLFNIGYSKIIGIRDLFPNKLTEKETIIKLIRNKISELNSQNDIYIILAVMEIEAWFLLDSRLFEKINPILNIQNILDKLNINLNISDTEQFSHPAEIINKIINLIGEKYKKREKQSYNITHYLDYTELVCSDNIRNKSFKLFIEIFEKLTK